MNREISISFLMKYSKEELATFILRNNFLHNIETEMKYIHNQFLIEKDAKATDKEHSEELKLLEIIKAMPVSTFEEVLERMKLWDKYKKLEKKNITAYKKRQIEINKCIDNY